jgi:hypothetical protein
MQLLRPKLPLEHSVQVFPANNVGQLAFSVGPTTIRSYGTSSCLGCWLGTSSAYRTSNRTSTKGHSYALGTSTTWQALGMCALWREMLKRQCPILILHILIRLLVLVRGVPHVTSREGSIEGCRLSWWDCGLTGNRFSCLCIIKHILRIFIIYIIYTYTGRNVSCRACCNILHAYTM